LAVVIIVPLFERQAAGVYRNSAAIVDADGSLLGVYRKMHIPDDPLFNEKYYFTPGDAGPTNAGMHDDRVDQIGRLAKQASGFHVWKTRYANVGVLICWDQWYPEAARITSLLGASPNRIGHEDEPNTNGITFFGHSFISDPFGRLLAEAGTEEAILTATLDPKLMETIRRNWPFLRDRRVDAYAPILSRYLGAA